MRLTFEREIRPLPFFGFLLALSLLFSLPSLLRLPRVLPFLDPAVRAETPGMLRQLRASGLWLVNTDLVEIAKQENGICFFWDHTYTSRMGKEPTELIATCNKL